MGLFRRLVCVKVLIFVILCGVSQYECYSETLKLAAFNIEKFGKTKMAKDWVVDMLVDIVSKFDLVLIQEIRDKSGKAITELLERVNAVNEDRPFSMTISPRLGRTGMKEQYAFFYRTSAGLRVVYEYVFDDGLEEHGDDYFEREPYVVLFESRFTFPATRFTLIGMHVQPKHAVQELTLVEKVFFDAYNTMHTENIMLMGDLNADYYVPDHAWSSIPIRQNPAYVWLIGDGVDTTIAKNRYTYDRFVMTGSEFLETYISESAIAFRFDDFYGLSMEDARTISDHYPIVLELRMDRLLYAHEEL